MSRAPAVAVNMTEAGPVAPVPAMPRPVRWRPAVVGHLDLACVLVLAGCATGIDPGAIERSPSRAFTEPETTTLGRVMRPPDEAQSGDSGFLLLRTGEGGYLARAGLAGLAERSIDAQYYIWEPDLTGRLLAERLLDAADRGSGSVSSWTTSTSTAAMRSWP